MVKMGLSLAVYIDYRPHAKVAWSQTLPFAAYKYCGELESVN
jgi:hypothetical protein